VCGLRKHIAIVFFISILLILLTDLYAESLKAQIYPKTISPGDAFLVKITDVECSSSPSASLDGKEFFFSGCGENCSVAIGATDLETKPGGYTVKVKDGGKQRDLKLTVRKTKFKKLKMTLPADKVFLSPDDLDLVKNENKRLDVLFQKVSEKQWDGSFIFPLKNDLSTSFGTKRIMNKKWVSIHKGLDIKGRTGEEVKAANRGRVVLAEELFYGGKTVILDHGQGIYTVYMHLAEYKIKPDDIISKSDVIGLVGSSGRSSGPHLHFGVKVMNINVNPVSLIKLEL
jgi:murein DD-endopeptidase MepM/ murein hydrolase activator NlpD